MSIGRWRTFLNVKFFNFKEFIFCLKFYKNSRFCLSDLALIVIYFFINPYKVSKKFLIKKNNAEIHCYGETPLTTLELIAKNCNLNSSDTLIELGSGRGRAAFWLAHFIKCRIIAVEWIGTFFKIAKIISKIFKKRNVSFVQDDILEVSLQEATVIYLYGTMLQDEDILKLAQKFKTVKDLKIITISYPLKDYDSSFNTLKSFEVSFPWGKTFCYLNKLS